MHRAFMRHMRGSLDLKCGVLHWDAKVRGGPMLQAIQDFPRVPIVETRVIHYHMSRQCGQPGTDQRGVQIMNREHMIQT